MTLLTIDPGARRYTYWTVGLEPAGESAEVELSIDDGVSWQTLEWVSDPAEGQHLYRVLVAGPDAETQDGGTENPPGTLVLEEGRGYRVRIRRVDNPEIEIENAGFLACA